MTAATGNFFSTSAPPPFPIPGPNLLCRRIVATTDRYPGAKSSFRNRVFQQLLMAKGCELTAVPGNFNRYRVKSGDAADFCSGGVDGRAGTGAGGLRLWRQAIAGTRGIS